MQRHIIDTAHATGSQRASVVVWDPGPVSLLALAGVLDSQGYRCLCARDASGVLASLEMGPLDLLVCDVADDAPFVLDTLANIRNVDGYDAFPAVLIADVKWAGLEKKTESMRQATRCLFKPIDPNSLIAVVDQLTWMPTLVSTHRRMHSSPSRPGWVTF